MMRAMLFLALMLLVVTAAPKIGQSNQAKPTCTISFQARVFVQWGPDAIPPNKKFYVLLPKSHFYLMDTDPALLLQRAALPNPEFESYDGTSERRPAGLGIYLSALEMSRYGGFHGGNSHLRGFYEKAAKIIDPHILQAVETDREGKAAFTAVPPGTYFIVGSASSPHAKTWNLKVEVNQVATQFVLDEKNAL